MEDNATRAIMIGVGLFVILLIITGVILYVNAARNMASVVNKSINTWDNITYSNIMEYNGDATIECTGMDFINFIRENFMREDIFVTINSGKETILDKVNMDYWKNEHSNTVSEIKLASISVDSKVTMKKETVTDENGVNTYYITVKYTVDLPVIIRAYETKDDAQNGVNSIQNGASIIVGKEEKEKKIYYKVNYGNSDTLKSIKLTIFAKGGIKETKTILPGDENLDTANRRYICEVEYNNIPVFNAYAVAEVEYEKLPSTKAASNKFDINTNNQGDNQGNNPGDNQGEIMYGDVNGDGKIDSFDSSLLGQYLAGWNVEINKQNADVNGDGKIDSFDSSLLGQYLAGWNVKLGPQG